MPDRLQEQPEPRPIMVGASVGDVPAVEFSDVEISYGKFVAVHDFSLSIEKGSFVTLLGRGARIFSKV